MGSRRLCRHRGVKLPNRGEVVLSQFLFVLFLFLPGIAHALRPADGNVIDFTLEVSFDIPASKVNGVVTIPVKKGQEIRLDIAKLTLLYVNLDKEKLDISGQEETVKILSSRQGTVEIGFEGTFKNQQPEQTSSMIDRRGIFLTGAWYPRPDQMCLYHLTAALPNRYEAVSEAEAVDKTQKEGKTIFAFYFPHPLDGINLIAMDRYKIIKDHFNGVEIFAYFFWEDAHLIPTYIEHTKHYLKLYENLISKFPYKRFSVVENFLPTGYSMPTYTLLGQEVVRLPFIPATSLGHEILHQWFGNLVYIDYSKGNWAEGLTTYLADHLYEEENGLGFEYRKGALIDYQSYVNEKNEFPLKDFQARTDDASKAIGYGKALLVFQMLKKMVGEKRFYESVRYLTDEMRFRKASWEDIERAFEKYYQKDLAWFFHQWIDAKGLAEIHLKDIRVTPLGPKFEVTFTITQKRGVYTLDLPVILYSARGKVKNLFHLGSERGHFKMLIDDIPERLVIDEDYDVARMLSTWELPPVIERLLGDEELTIVLPLLETDIYDEIIHTLKKRGAKVSESNYLKVEDTKTSSLAILGADNPLVGRLYGRGTTQGGFSVLVKENPWNSKKVTGIFSARSKEEVHAAFQKIFHYGKYSALSFDHGINVEKKINETARGLTEELFEQPIAVEISTLKNLSEVMARVSDKEIIYVGETHDQFSHHLMELEIIKNLHRRGKEIAIGMEMFQRPFQKGLNDYIEGRIDEVDKVFRGGLDSLSEEENGLVPSQMDFSDQAYKERLEKIFREHEDFETKNFDFFHEAQILWDETMSESIDTFLRARPGCQMVVLTGSGHLTFGSGIPKRTARRKRCDYAIILNGVNIEKDIADYVLYPETVPGPTSPRLMVLLTEKGEKVEITGFPHGSNSKKAGIRVGDAILSIDRTPIHDIDDLKIELLSKKKGEKVKLRILRRSLFGIKQEMDFEVALQ